MVLLFNVSLVGNAINGPSFGIDDKDLEAGDIFLNRVLFNKPIRELNRAVQIRKDLFDLVSKARASFLFQVLNKVFLAGDIICRALQKSFCEQLRVHGLKGIHSEEEPEEREDDLPLR